MTHAWEGGFLDKKNPQAPLQSIASTPSVDSGIIMVEQPPTQVLPVPPGTQHFSIASQPQVQEDQGWHHCHQPDNCQPEAVMPEVASMASDAVQLAHQAPQSPFAIEYGGAQALEAFFEVTDKAGFPRHATLLKWGGHA